MPKKTFSNLKKDKKDKLMTAFLKEFSNKRYEDASISNVVKELGIAKGSIYQYFKDKLDLFFYLKQHCEGVKFSYIKNISRNDFQDFWAFYKSLYQEGINFDLEHPLESNFLYALANQQQSPALKAYFQAWQQQALTLFTNMVEHEIKLGHFRNDLPARSIAYFIVTLSSKIGDYIAYSKGVNIDQKLYSGESIFASDNGKTLLEAVDEHIKILKQACKKYDTGK